MRFEAVRSVFRNSLVTWTSNLELYSQNFMFLIISFLNKVINARHEQKKNTIVFYQAGIMQFSTQQLNYIQPSCKTMMQKDLAVTAVSNPVPTYVECVIL